MKNWFLVKNPNGIELAAFPLVGQAANFCHINGHPIKWIKSCDIEIKIKEDVNFIVINGTQV